MNGGPQAASASQLDRWQIAIARIRHAMNNEDYTQVTALLDTLLRSMIRAERR